MSIVAAIVLVTLCACIAIAVWAWRIHVSLRVAEGAGRDAVERRYTLLEAIPDGVYILGEDERITHINDEAERLLRSQPGAFVGERIEDILDPLASDLVPEIRKARAAGEILSRVVHFRSTGWWVEIRIKPATAETVIYLRDVTVRKSAEARLKDSEGRLRILMEQVPAVLWSVDRQGRFASVSGAGLPALGVRESDLLDQSCMLFLGSDSAADSLTAVFDGESVQFESALSGRWLRHHVEPLRGTDGAIIGAVGASLDISEIKDTQDRLEAAARRDALTGLPNRRALEEVLADSLSDLHRRRTDTGLAALFIDLDRFKTINDTLGHRVGDDVLRVVAERLRTTVGSGDIIARPGGDEFIVVLTNVASTADVAAVSARLLRRFAEPIVVDGRQLFVSASIGAALSPQHGTTAEELIKNADAAMYRAKAAGRATFAFYDVGMESSALERLTLENDLRGALLRDELYLMYQPIVDVPTGRVVGAEALLRWPHPRLGMLQPNAFIDLAEESGLIVDVTRWVLRRACALGAAVRRRRPDFRVTVNLSPRDLRESDVVHAIRQELVRAQLEPDGLEIEVTENVVLDDSSIAALAQLRDLGVRIAVDDFGMAYSSLSYVKRLPITSLKIDKSFVRDVAKDHFDQAIVKTIVTLGSSLGLRVIAEGIETDAQQRFVQQLGCHEAQGFLFSRPLDPRALEALLDDDVAAEELALPA